MPVPDSKDLRGMRVQENLVKFLLEAPYFFNRNYIPPLPVLNCILRTGEWRTSMNPGLKWDPFEMGMEQYNSLVQGLLASKRDFKSADCPAWVESPDDWQIFLAELVDGVPPGQHREILRRAREAERARDDVMFGGKPGNISDLAKQAIVANLELSDFLEQWIKREG